MCVEALLSAWPGLGCPPGWVMTRCDAKGAALWNKWKCRKEVVRQMGKTCIDKMGFCVLQDRKCDTVRGGWVEWKSIWNVYEAVELIGELQRE